MYLRGVAKDSFRHEASADVVALIDEAARRSGLDRGRVFDDFLLVTLCSLSGGRMEPQYLEAVKPYTAGQDGKRAIDLLPQVLGTIVHAMEETRADILGDVFVGAITRGHNGQFFTPDPVCRLMAQLTDDGRSQGTVCDPCCGSGRMLLAAAEVNCTRQFIGQDIDLRCVRITAINLALWNLYGWVIHGNSLALEKKLVYRTGFDGTGCIKEVPPEECPFPAAGAAEPLRSASVSIGDVPPTTVSSVQKNLFE